MPFAPSATMGSPAAPQAPQTPQTPQYNQGSQFGQNAAVPNAANPAVPSQPAYPGAPTAMPQVPGGPQAPAAPQATGAQTQSYPAYNPNGYQIFATPGAPVPGGSVPPSFPNAAMQNGPKKPFYKQWWVYVVAVVAVLAILVVPWAVRNMAGNGGHASNSDASVINLSRTKLGSKLPALKNARGEIRVDSDEMLMFNVEDATESMYKDYVKAAKAKGYTSDMTELSTIFQGASSDNYYLSIMYDSTEKQMSVDLIQQTDDSNDSTSDDDSSSSDDSTSNKSDRSSSDIDPTFKQTVDQYEDVMTRYYTFMKTYDANSSSQRDEYLKFANEAADVSSKLAKIDSDNLTTAEVKYLLDANERIQKMAKEYENSQSSSDNA